MNKIWDIRGETGFLGHTDQPQLHEVHSDFFIIDFPGSDGIEEHHSRAFNLLASMNNLLILVIRFDGDVNEATSRMVARALKATAGSKSARVLLCINRCGQDFPQVVRYVCAFQILRVR